MPETRVTIAGRVHRLDIEYGEKAYLVVEVECTAEGQHRTKSGDIPTRKIEVTDALRLSGELPAEMLEELRAQRREAEGDATGIDVIPGLEGFLDSGGVVITEADGITTAKIHRVTDDDLADDEAEAIARWVELGLRVHELAALSLGSGKSAEEARIGLDGLWAEVNCLLPGDLVVEGAILDEAGNERPTIELPDIEPVAEPEVAEVPFDGYDALDPKAVISHVDDYLDADGALGGPSPESRAYVEAVRVYEVAHGARPKVVRPLEARLAAIDDALATRQPEEQPATDGPPWESYDGTTVDGIIGRLQTVAENEGPDVARALVAAVDAYESAHKKRKGVLGRLDGIVQPPIPDGPDLELELDDDDEFEPDEDERPVEDVDLDGFEG